MTRSFSERTSPVSSSYSLSLSLPIFFFSSFFSPLSSLSVSLSLSQSRGRCSIKIPQEPRLAGNVVGEARVRRDPLAESKRNFMGPSNEDEGPDVAAF